MKIGNRLFSDRGERKMTQEEMAELLGVSTSTYARLERNESSAQVEQIADFSKILEIPIQEFLPDTLSIRNNSKNGQVGFVIGNIYNHNDKDELNKEIQHQLDLENKENKHLLDKIKMLENRIQDLEEIIKLLKKS